MALRKFRSVIVKMLVQFFRYIIDSMVHGIMTILNSGGKKRIPEIKNELLLQPAFELAARIRRGELSSEKLVRVYIERIIEVNGYINAIVDSRFADALKEAREVDKQVRSGTLSEKQMVEDLPLLGIPFTAKEAIVIKGLSNTGGMVRRKGRTAAKDCEAVQMMRSSGAIPVAVTVIPELCLWWESYNNIHGKTKNPYNTRRTPGGSSGGEGALIASAGSIIGVGSDLAGSIRLPGFFNGIFGHMPTNGIVPIGGQYPPIPKEMESLFFTGPMARYAGDLKLVLSALIGKGATQKLNLLNPVDVKSIKVYYMLDDGGNPATTPVSPDIKNGIKRVVNTLSNDGFTVKQVNLNYLKAGMDIWTSFMMTIKGATFSDFLQGKGTKDKNYSLKEMCKWMFGKSSHTFSALVMAFLQDVTHPIRPKHLNFYLECGAKVKQELLDLLEPEPAVFLYPTYPQVAPYLGQILFNPSNLGYCAIFNSAAMPVTQCPLGLDASGLPFGMQIVTAPNNDRFSISVAEYVEEKFGGWVQPS